MKAHQVCTQRSPCHPWVTPFGAQHKLISKNTGHWDPPNSRTYALKEDLVAGVPEATMITLHHLYYGWGCTVSFS